MAEAVTSDMASSDWLKLAALFCFARKVYLKINPFVTAGARPQADRSALLSNSLLVRLVDFTLSDVRRFYPLMRGRGWGLLEVNG